MKKNKTVLALFLTLNTFAILYLILQSNTALFLTLISAVAIFFSVITQGQPHHAPQRVQPNPGLGRPHLVPGGAGHTHPVSPSLGRTVGLNQAGAHKARSR